MSKAETVWTVSQQLVTSDSGSASICCNNFKYACHGGPLEDRDSLQIPGPPVWKVSQSSKKGWMGSLIADYDFCSMSPQGWNSCPTEKSQMILLTWIHKLQVYYLYGMKRVCFIGGVRYLARMNFRKCKSRLKLAKLPRYLKIHTFSVHQFRIGLLHLCPHFQALGC